MKQSKEKKEERKKEEGEWRKLTSFFAKIKWVNRGKKIRTALDTALITEVTISSYGSTEEQTMGSILWIKKNEAQ